jgi:hypothetical protein
VVHAAHFARLDGMRDRNDRGGGSEEKGDGSDEVDHVGGGGVIK